MSDRTQHYKNKSCQYHLIIFCSACQAALFASYFPDSSRGGFSHIKVIGMIDLKSGSANKRCEGGGGLQVSLAELSHFGPGETIQVNPRGMRMDSELLTLLRYPCRAKRLQSGARQAPSLVPEERQDPSSFPASFQPHVLPHLLPTFLSGFSLATDKTAWLFLGIIAYGCMLVFLQLIAW